MSLIERPSHFTSLPRDYYLSEELCERELERIFERQWLYFGHVSQVAEPGDYFAREIVRKNVLVTRTADGEIAAFANVCRHRGAWLCRTCAGQ
jgi:phenylpropionate dioxygenase-like ring-hydroxylating dioxygenase large terminal subunit